MVLSNDPNPVPQNDLLNERIQELERRVQELERAAPETGLSYQQAADYLGISHVYLRDLVSKGLVPQYKYGDDIRSRVTFDKTDLEEFKSRYRKKNENGYYKYK